MRACITTSVLVATACASASQVDWEYATTRAFLTLDASIHEGECGSLMGELRYASSGMPGMLETPPALDDGPYCVSLRTVNAACEIVEQAATTYILPSDAPTLVLTAAPAANTICRAGTTCNGSGVCLPSADAGLTDSGPDGRDAGAEDTSVPTDTGAVDVATDVNTGPRFEMSMPDESCGDLCTRLGRACVGMARVRTDCGDMTYGCNSTDRRVSSVTGSCDPNAGGCYGSGSSTYDISCCECE